MQRAEQGMHLERYAVIPRTLTFLTHEGDVLLLRGAPDKTLWAGRLNGVGGHVEPDEDVCASARREVREETGLDVGDLALRGIVHVGGEPPLPGVVLFVFVAEAPSRETQPSPEGHLEWHPVAHLPEEDLVADLPALLPRVLRPSGEGLVYGHYAPGPSGALEFRFRPPA